MTDQYGTKITDPIPQIAHATVPTDPIPTPDSHNFSADPQLVRSAVCLANLAMEPNDSRTGPYGSLLHKNRNRRFWILRFLPSPNLNPTVSEGLVVPA